MDSYDTPFARERLAHDPMPRLVFDVAYAVPISDVLKTFRTVKGVSGAQAADLRDRYPECTIVPHKLLPCAQRVVPARIATPPSAGQSPANGRGGDL
jgi:hypothetical protein